MPEQKKAVIYARVSTEEQANEGFSIQAQLEELHRYAELQKMVVVNEYVDEGFSGKNITGRPKMQQLLKDASLRKFEVVLVYKMDRIARNLKDALEIHDELQRNDIKLVSAIDNYDTSTPMGKMVFQIMGSFAELERNTIVGRVKMGMTQRAKLGKFNGGQCLGYDSVSKTLVVNESEALIVREIFNLAEQGLGYKAIVSRINEKGYRTKKGNQFAVNAVKEILSNPIYIGKIRFNKLENWNEKRRKGRNKDFILADGEHQPLIQLEQWERVQEIRQKRSYKPKRSNDPYILSGLIKCPMCGTGMVPGTSKGEGGRSYRYYICGQHHNKGRTACKANSIRADIAENEVMEQLSLLITRSGELQHLLAMINEQRINAIQPVLEEKAMIQSKIKQCESKINRLVEELLDGTISKTILTPKLNQLEEDKNQFEHQLTQLDTSLTKADTTPIDYEALRTLLTDLHQTLSVVDADHKKALLRLVIKEIQISKDAPRGIGRRIEKIIYSFDFTDAASQNIFDLIDMLYHEFKDRLSHLKVSGYELVPSESLLKGTPILPLAMIRFTSIDPKCAVNLF
ncbi:recombinase family protein [Anoxybacteroides amylolyticum]|uniref:Recombinase family protein n=1 Tax=Anoxybacteroides amylolyticum TaxID=294699 RepID=A0A161HXT8_9BACL|nr:recombinase family protein [Anoxybacillus amylolyticus]ANB59529.1 hypothetical protein GFC30_237 [Anoxybacillus amylolyticus]